MHISIVHIPKVLSNISLFICIFAHQVCDDDNEIIMFKPIIMLRSITR